MKYEQGGNERTRTVCSGSLWACDLMLQTANFILRWNEDVAILSQAAFREDGNIIVDTTKCEKYKEWLINNYLCDLTNDMSI